LLPKEKRRAAESLGNLPRDSLLLFSSREKRREEIREETRSSRDSDSKPRGGARDARDTLRVERSAPSLSGQGGGEGITK